MTAGANRHRQGQPRHCGSPRHADAWGLALVRRQDQLRWFCNRWVLVVQAPSALLPECHQDRATPQDWKGAYYGAESHTQEEPCQRDECERYNRLRESLGGGLNERER